MKEATNELSASVIVIGAVAMLSALFFTFVWPIVKDGLTNDATCANAVCDVGYNENYMAYCYAPGKEGDVFECPFKG